MSRVLLITTVLASAIACAPEGEVELSQNLDRYLEARTTLGRFSGAALVARGEEILLRRGYGFADIETERPFTPETPFAAASLSKMFTAAAAVKLEETGRLGLDDRVCQWIPDCPASWSEITLRHLIQHRSGIPDYEERLELGSEAYFELMAAPGAAAKIVDDACDRPLEFSPGEKFHYSNTGYVLLGEVIERAAGQPFAEVVSETVLVPAGMSSSGVLGEGRTPAALAQGYGSDDIGWAAMLGGVSLTGGHLHRLRELAHAPPTGDGWIFTTVDDLHRWSRLVDQSATEEGYSFGWIVDRAFERRRMRHNGILPGYVSELVLFPDEGITIVLLSNLDNVRMSRILRDVSAIALGEPYDMPVQGTVVELDEQQIAQLTGDYRTEEGVTLSIRKEPDYLIAELPGAYTAGLIPLSATEMYFPMGDGRAIFTLGGDGRAVSVNMRHGGVDHVAKR